MKYEVYEKPEATIIDLGEAILTDMNIVSSNAHADANPYTTTFDSQFNWNN